VLQSLSVNTTCRSNIKVNVDYVFGLDGSRRMVGVKLTSLPRLTSNVETCYSFDFLQNRGAKSYKFRVKMFATQGSSPLLKGFMSLPNQTRGYDRFQLFRVISLPNYKTTEIAYSVYSLKVLEKRSTAADPCIAVENYDRVRNLFLLPRYFANKNDFIMQKAFASQPESVNLAYVVTLW